MTKQPTMAYVLSILIIILAALTSSTGLLNSQIYASNSAYVFPRIISQDLVTLIIAVPFLIITASLAAGKSRRGYLAWLGGLAYFLYTYISYAFGNAYNQLFLAYVALFSLSLFALIKGMVSLDVEAVSLRFSRKTPVKTAGIFCIVSGLIFAFIWLGKILPSLVAGKQPQFLEVLGTTTMVNQVLDLGIVAPLAIITGIWLWKRRPWGFALTCFILFKAITTGLAGLLVIFIAFQQRHLPGTGEVICYGCYTLLAVVLLARFLTFLREEVIKSYHDQNSVSYF
jgi:hypothetical protein